ncbi:MAG: SRPBCC family protein [Actinomycetota bacterium]
MSSLSFYRFRSEWELAAPRGRVFDVLRRGETYERWWPEVKRASRLNDGRYELVARSFLPYELHMVLTESVVDEGAGILEASIMGDLKGFSRWTLLERGDRTIAVFDEEVVTHKRLLDVLAPLARPLLRYNHTVMMRHGERGLRRYLTNDDTTSSR